MKKTITSFPAKIIVGISARTNNADEQKDWVNGRILFCLQKYFGQNLAARIPHRIQPGTTLCIYADYESDHTGMYTYFIGEEVSKLETLPEGLESMVIPAQTYAKFTTDPGDMPAVVQNAWFEIWQMDEKQLGGKRAYKADFEVYDERAATPDHRNVVLDVLIGIEEGS